MTRLTINLWAARIFITLIVLPLVLVTSFTGELRRAFEIGWLNARMEWAAFKLLWSDPWQ